MLLHLEREPGRLGRRHFNMYVTWAGCRGGHAGHAAEEVRDAHFAGLPREVAGAAHQRRIQILAPASCIVKSPCWFHCRSICQDSTLREVSEMSCSADAMLTAVRQKRRMKVQRQFEVRCSMASGRAATKQRLGPTCAILINHRCPNRCSLTHRQTSAVQHHRQWHGALHWSGKQST
jgi:hypothetical protein